MAALSADRDTKRRDGDRFSRQVKGGVILYAGALVCLDANRFAVPGATATTLKADGIVKTRVDNSLGADGAVTAQVHPGIYRFDNSAAGDLIAQADIKATCYIVDDHTVAKTDGGGTRSVAGKIEDVDAQGVWVSVGDPAFAL